MKFETMVYCPNCKENFPGDLTSCPKCNYDFNGHEAGKEDKWPAIGMISDRTSADYARETLLSYNVPCVVFSGSGYLGNAGLSMPSFTGKVTAKYVVHVPAEHREEAENILTMILGDGWEKIADKD
nr:hypothetical protein [candidate division Zixibacteria bacterium]